MGIYKTHSDRSIHHHDQSVALSYGSLSYRGTSSTMFPYRPLISAIHALASTLVPVTLPTSLSYPLAIRFAILATASVALSTQRIVFGIACLLRARLPIPPVVEFV